MRRVSLAFLTLFFFVPIGAGLVGTVLPAFDFLPALGGQELGTQAWQQLLSSPGLLDSVLLTIGIGVSACLLSLLLALSFLAWIQPTAWGRHLSHLLGPLLGTPHSALAIGLAFLLLPSGWIARAISPWLTGWSFPPDLLIVGHPSGWPVVLALTLKETPYLLLILLAVVGQSNANRLQIAAQTLGYSPARAWFKVVLPVIYPHLRLPLMAVLAFSLSVVDVAMILGPAEPATLSVWAVRRLQDPDLQFYFQAASAAMLQLLLVACTMLLWRGAELVLARMGRGWMLNGVRVAASSGLAIAVRIFALLPAVLFAIAALSIVSLLVWSFADRWRFPFALPTEWTLQNWSTFSGTAADLLTTTVFLALGSVSLALLVSMILLETQPPAGSTRFSAAWLYPPLLLPQIAFLFGIQVVLVRLHLDGNWFSVVWIHWIFVLPYVYLSLEQPWLSLDRRYLQVAASLGVPRKTAFLRIKLALLLKPILAASAVGCAVSVGLYLPTLFAGAGRISTLTTEAVTLAGNADRRALGVLAFVQALIPLFAFVAALLVPRLLFRNRRGML